MKLADIKRHWQASGESFPAGGSVTPTSRDPYLGDLERENIAAFLRKSQSCLEVGCGDATHTVHYARKVKRLTAVDLAESLVEIGKKRIAEEGLTNVEMSSGSVLDLGKKFKGRTFDCVLSQRCLINLPTWEYQKKAIDQIHGLLADGGLFILSEGFQEKLENLNSLRRTFALPRINVVAYNKNFVSKEFEVYIKKRFEVVAKRDYGLYLVLSRVYHPLAVAPEQPKHDSVLNKAARDLAKAIAAPEMEKYSYNLFYVLQKKEARVTSSTT